MKCTQTRILLFIFLLAPSIPTFACTTIILSGKATKDGRPLMWKNSDTTDPRHSLFYSDYKGYPFLGIVRNTSVNENTASIWMGTNSEGFSIMNTLSYNLTEEQESSRNGAVMRKALEICRTVSDFKNMLDTLPRPMKIEANFGVIDAEGNAAYFEASSGGYQMLDVNDPAVAPEGYLIYTNFSYKGFFDKGEGYIRYLSAGHEVAKCLPSKDFSPQWIFNHLSRSFYHSLMDVDFGSKQVLEIFRGYLHDSDFIPRRSTASSTVIHGVRKGENPDLTTMWVALGYPPCSVAVPAWVKAGKDNPSIVMRRDDETHSSKMCDMVLALKETLFDVKRGHGQEYFNFYKVCNSEGSGYMQKLAPVENQIFRMTNPLLAKWREAGKPDTNEIQALGKAITGLIENSWPGQETNP
ncbi:MAG: C45 family peptidase [Candidatus Symbiothrix sp.]|jgi:hypothetical protein|nr:C45 family peptidase [Candidatus Symbiothrix sp.]